MLTVDCRTMENELKRGIDLIKRFEGKMNKAYLCPALKWTVGYGHVIFVNGKMADSKSHKFNELPKEFQNLTDEQCEKLLLKDVVPYANKAKSLCPEVINSNQLGALTSFAFNCGIKALETSSLRRYINSTEEFDVARIEYLFGQWKFADGRILNGLILRRQAEADLFNEPIAIKIENPPTKQPMEKQKREMPLWWKKLFPNRNYILNK